MNNGKHSLLTSSKHYTSTLAVALRPDDIIAKTGNNFEAFSPNVPSFAFALLNEFVSKLCTSLSARKLARDRYAFVVGIKPALERNH